MHYNCIVHRVQCTLGNNTLQAMFQIQINTIYLHCILECSFIYNQANVLHNSEICLVRFDVYKLSIHTYKIQPMFSIHLTNFPQLAGEGELTYLEGVTNICVGTLTITGSDNVLSPGRRQAIIWTKAGLLWIALMGIYFSKIWIGLQSFSFKKMQSKMSSAKMAAILSRGIWV